MQLSDSEFAQNMSWWRAKWLSFTSNSRKLQRSVWNKVISFKENWTKIQTSVGEALERKQQLSKPGLTLQCDPCPGQTASLHVVPLSPFSLQAASTGCRKQGESVPGCRQALRSFLTSTRSGTVGNGTGTCKSRASPNGKHMQRISELKNREQLDTGLERLWNSRYRTWSDKALINLLYLTMLWARPDLQKFLPKLLIFCLRNSYSCQLWNSQYNLLTNVFYSFENLITQFLAFHVAFKQAEVSQSISCLALWFTTEGI